MTPIEIVHNALILALSVLCWAGIWLNWRWQRTARRIAATRDECIALVTDQAKHVADLERRVHAAYAMLVTIAHAPLPADEKVTMCAEFLQATGISGRVEMRVEAPPAPQVH